VLEEETEVVRREQMDDLSLFKAFHKEILGEEPSEVAQQLFVEVLQEMLTEERETKEVVVK
jgi:exonuclease SbcD